jgi:tRNA U38,U39,U40 pseudouridine synthase TruA
VLVGSRKLDGVWRGDLAPGPVPAPAVIRVQIRMLILVLFLVFAQCRTERVAKDANTDSMHRARVKQARSKHLAFHTCLSRPFMWWKSGEKVCCRDRRDDLAGGLQNGHQRQRSVLNT